MHSKFQPDKKAIFQYDIYRASIVDVGNMTYKGRHTSSETVPDFLHENLNFMGRIFTVTSLEVYFIIY